MSTAARLYLGTVVGAAAVAIAAAFALGDVAGARWVAFAVIAAGTASSYLRPLVARRTLVLRTSDLYTAAGVILLPAPLLLLAAVAPFLSVGFRQEDRRPVHDLFNVANLSLTALGGWAAYHALDAVLPLSAGPRHLLAGAALVLVLPLLNRGLLGVMLRLSDGMSIRSVVTGDRLWLVAAGSACLGVATAELWQLAPWAVPFAIAPVVLGSQALSVPRLVDQAARDAKTQLYNASRFAEAAAQELASAARVRRQVSTVLLDLDFLREINNAHGHLAGDAVLVAVADVIRHNVRAQDVAARFGGEEFAILLPDTAPEDALLVAERIRRGVEETAVEYAPGGPLHATVSIGVASFPRDADDVDSLLRAADLALYRAKDAGRNVVVPAA